MPADSDPRWRVYLPPAVQDMPADLAAVVALVVLTVLSVVLPGVRETPIRILLGLLFVLFVPGYAFIAALFPEAGTRGSDPDSTSAVESVAPSRDHGIDGIERVALSFGTSIAVVPLIGLALNFTPWGIRLAPILISVSGFTLVAVFVGTWRRATLDPDDRFEVPYREWIARARRELFEPDTKTDLALNVLLVVSILLAVGSVGYAVAVPQQGESFTEFYLLTEDEDGDLVADGYPTDFVAGEPKSLVVGVTNQEHERVSYTVVTEVQRVETANNSTTVLESESGPRFSPTLEHNETWTRQHQIAPTMTGERLRLTYLLYRGDPPATPNTENAYRELHLWVNVTAT